MICLTATEIVILYRIYETTKAQIILFRGNAENVTLTQRHCGALFSLIA
jgi:hypothetical protein